MKHRGVHANTIRWKLITLMVAVLIALGTWFAQMTRHTLITGDEQFTIGQGIGMTHFYWGVENTESSPAAAINHVASLMHLAKPIPGVAGYGIFLKPGLAAAAHHALTRESLNPQVTAAIGRAYPSVSPHRAWVPYFLTNAHESHIPTALLTQTVTQKKTVWLSPWTHPHLLTLAPILWQGHIIGVSVVDQIPAERAVPFVNHLMEQNLLLQLSALLVLTGFLYWVIGRLVVRPIQYQAEHDLMTRLYNQVTFWHLFDQTAALMAQRELPMALLILDMDHFKQVNDTYGHQQGDHVLRSLADIIRRHTRNTDLTGRLGGEEFGVVLPGSSAQEAQAVAEAIRQDLETHMLGDKPLTVSIGIAFSHHLPAHGLQPQALAFAADMALYEAKEHGRNRVVCYQPNPERNRLIEQTILSVVTP